MPRSRLVSSLWLGLAIGWWAGCASGGLDESSGGGAGFGGAVDASAGQGGGGGTSGGGAAAATGGQGAAAGGQAGAAGDAAAPDGATLHPLCAAGCRLDDPTACAVAVPGTGPDSGGAGDAGAGDAGAGDAGDAEGGYSDGPGPGSTSACRVDLLAETPTTSCGPAGGGAADSPCLESRDCAPGFGCVASGGAGRCLPFCCTPDACTGERAFCDERALRATVGDAGAPPTKVPVCVAPDDCNLAEESPCTTNTCKCSAGTACMVVGPAGATACVEPGAGRTGEPCPCARGYVCSQATATCLKLCPVSLTTADCGGGSCQGDSNLPDGWGICVGGGGDGGA
ncbi:MAG: hypothetical protein IT376_14285 [Polyangiaceae bacterium]|nr:hypothetical protein [Polyangiaceae bacterium]